MASLSNAVQVLLISSGVVLLALALNFSVPLVVDFSVYQAPVLWSSFASWLRPLYLYVIINFIILIIVASSRFHHDKQDHQDLYVPLSKAEVVRDAVRMSDGFEYQVKVSKAELRPEFAESMVEREDEEEKAVISSVFEDKSTVLVNGAVQVEDRDDDEFVISKSTWIPPNRMESSENLPLTLSPAEKPPVYARFSHRKPVRASPEGGRALKVSKPRRHETLENTWKAITEGRAMPLTRHLKKSDSLENYHGRDENASPLDPFLVKKSETFKDRTNYQSPPNAGSSPASGRLRKEPSLSQDELNRRVEAFIKKFNEEMRLQRQESLNQYKEMVSRGGY